MCRWMAYSGNQIPLELLLFNVKNNLIDQSLSSRSAETPTNGEISEVEKLRRDLVLAIDPTLFSRIQGTTDSEVMFYLALTFGLERDPLGALARMAGLVERTGREHGVAESLWMTLGVSDGESIWAVRYASDGDAPTLYYSREVADLARWNPDVPRILGEEARAVVSEPVGKFAELWTAVPQGCFLRVRGADLEVSPFVLAD